MLPYGALVLERLLKRLGPSAVDFSVFGIREGLVYSLMSETERRKDPLLSFCAEYAGALAVRGPRLRAVRLDRCLFEPPGPKGRRRSGLRHAACLLSDISWRAHPDYAASRA